MTLTTTSSLEANDMVKLAQEQDLPHLRECLRTVLDLEIPSFARRSRPPPQPILDNSAELGYKHEDHVETMPDEMIINMSHVSGLRKFKGDLVHELKVLEKVPLTVSS